MASECSGVTLTAPMPGDDIAQLWAVARALRMTVLQRREFGDFVEAEKAAGRWGTKNDKGDFTFPELMDLGRLFLDG